MGDASRGRYMGETSSDLGVIRHQLLPEFSFHQFPENCHNSLQVISTFTVVGCTLGGSSPWIMTHISVCCCCPTTAASHQYLPQLSCHTQTSVEEQSHRPDLSTPMGCLVLLGMEVSCYHSLCKCCIIYSFNSCVLLPKDWVLLSSHLLCKVSCIHL